MHQDVKRKYLHVPSSHHGEEAALPKTEAPQFYRTCGRGHEKKYSNFEMCDYITMNQLSST